MKSIYNLLLIFLLQFTVALHAFALDCSISRVEKVFKDFFRYEPVEKGDVQGQPAFGVKILDVKKIRVSDMDLCEVIFKFEVPDTEASAGINFGMIRNVAYLRNNVLFLGELRIREGEKVVYFTHNRVAELNKEIIESMKQRQQEHLKQVEDIVRDGEFLKKLADVSSGISHEKADYMVFVMIDPMCPHCKRIVEYFEEKIKDGFSLSVDYLFVPVMGENSRRIVTSVLCDFKNSGERLLKFKEKYVSGNMCVQGEEKVKKNLEFFEKLRLQGVPISLVFKKNLEKFEYYVTVLGADFKRFDEVLNVSGKSVFRNEKN